MYIMHVVVPSFHFLIVKSIVFLQLHNVAYVQSLSSSSSFPSSMRYDDDSITNTLQRKQRWKSAVSTLENSIQERSRFDHRAKFARLIGIYVQDENTRTYGRDNKILVQEQEKKNDDANILVAIQPDQGGRKLLFLDADNGRFLGNIELETQSAISQSKILERQQTQSDNKAANIENDMLKTSALRGMLVADEFRGKGYARLFLAIWLRLCMRGGVTPATTRINKPLLALTLVRLGFTPLRGPVARLSNINHLHGGIRTNANENPSQNDKKPKRKKLKEKQHPLVVEVSMGNEGKSVLLYSPLSTERLRNGFSAQEIISQRLVVVNEASTPRGRIAHLRVRYAPPQQMINRTTTSSNDLVGSSLLDNAKSNDTYESQSKKMIHLPLAESVTDCLRLSATQGPMTEGMPPSTEEKAEAMHFLIGRI